MKRSLCAGLVAALLAAPAFAALKEGDTAPAFEAPASLAGKTFSFSLRDALKKGPVVVYFYPSAYTGGCNVQAHTFAVNHDKFAAAGASIVGVSLDSIRGSTSSLPTASIAPARSPSRPMPTARSRAPTTST